MAELIDLNEFIREYKEDPEITKLNMIRRVIDDILEDINEGYYQDLTKDLCPPDYERICDNLGWPDFQDGGLFEQCIDIACDTILQINGYKPLNYLSDHKETITK